MKKLVTAIVVIISAILGGVLAINYVDNATPAEINLVTNSATSPTPSPTPSPQPALPETFVVENLNINAPVEHVGLDSENKMDVPKNANNVAWYNLGSRPGGFGNAVLAGHLDKENGLPAVFYRIATVKVGDKLKVIDQENKTYTYSVTDIVTYQFDQVPLEEIFGETDGFYLNLITCEGSFNSQTRNYSHRTVVYSTLDR